MGRFEEEPVHGATRRASGEVWDLAQFDGLDAVIDLPAIGTELAMANSMQTSPSPTPLAGEGALR